MKRRKKDLSIPQELRQLLCRADVREMEGADAREQILLAIIHKALDGDLKTIEFILKLTGEMPDGKEKAEDDPVLRVELGPGVWELAE